MINKNSPNYEPGSQQLGILRRVSAKIEDWKAYLIEKDDETMIKNIRTNTKTGRACGDECFLKTIEGLLERRIIALPRGRPRKKG